MNIIQFKEKYPQYADIDNEKLARKLHNKFYSDKPYEVFRNRFITGEGTELVSEPIQQTDAPVPAKTQPQQPDYRGFLPELGTALKRGYYGVETGLSTAYSKFDPYSAGADRAEEFARKATDPELAPGRDGGVRGFVANAIGETLPFMAGTVAAGATGGPAASFGFAASVEGGNAYRQAKEEGVNDREAAARGLVVGLVNGAIEQLQVKGILKTGKQAAKTIKKTAVDNALKRVLKKSGKITASQALNAAQEGIEESLQGTTEDIVAKAVSDRDLPEDFWQRRLKEFAGGATVGGILGGAASGVNLAADVGERVFQDRKLRDIVNNIPQKTEPVTRKQKARGHILKKEAGLNDQQYKEIAKNTVGKESMVDMSGQEADKFIDALDRVAKQKSTVAENATVEPPSEQQAEQLTAPEPEDFYRQAAAARAKKSLIENASGTVKDIVSAVDKAVTPISYRLEKINPELKRRVRDFAYDVSVNTAEHIKPVDSFKQQAKPALENKPARQALKAALLNSDADTVKYLADNIGFSESLEQVRAVLDDIHARARRVGMDVGYREDYWPRTISDAEGLTKHLYSQLDQGQRSLFQEAVKKQTKRKGRELTQEEKVYLLNSLMRGFTTDNIMLYLPGYAKQRQIETVTPDMLRYYADPVESAHRYVAEMERQIAEREFFGKQSREVGKLLQKRHNAMTSLAKAQSAGNADRIAKLEQRVDELSKQYNDMENRPLDESIGAWLIDAIGSGKIDPQQEQRVSKMLKSLFNKSRQSKSVSLIKNGIYMTTLGNPLSALVQIKDYSRALYQSPLGTVKGTAQFMAGFSPVKLEQLGVNDINVDIGSLPQILRLSGFSWTDKAMKQIYVNTVYNKLAKDSRKAQKQLEFMERLTGVFGKDAEKVIAMFKSKQVTPEVKKQLYNELLEIQPIAETEMPEGYLNANWGKMLYTLRTFGLKQLQWGFRELRNAKKRGGYPEALKKLVWGAFTLALAGASAELIRDFLRGKPLEDVEDYVLDEFLSFIFTNKYLLRQTKYKGPARAFIENLVPPTSIIDDPVRDIQDIINEKDRSPESVRRIPVVGEPYYWWFGRGREKIEEGRYD